MEVASPAPPNYPGTIYNPAARPVAATTTSTRTVDPIVQGTSVLAIKYDGGVAIAADTLASYGSLARYRDVRRVRPVGQYTVLGASGEYSDFQYLMDVLDEMMTTEFTYNDGATMYPKEIYNYLTRVLYNRRSKIDPLYNQLVVGGFRDGKGFLGLVDLHGTSYEDDTLATGYGNYIARPLLRKAYRPNLTAAEAKKILEDCLRVMFYRDARASNRVATVSAAGLSISEPYDLETDWLICSVLEN